MDGGIGTHLMWTPKPLCTPAHWRQRKTAKLTAEMSDGVGARGMRYLMPIGGLDCCSRRRSCCLCALRARGGWAGLAWGV